MPGMKYCRTVYLILFFTLWEGTVYAQAPGFDFLIQLTELSKSRFEPTIQRKNFTALREEQSGDSIITVFQQQLPRKTKFQTDSALRIIARIESQNTSEILYTTSSAGEWYNLRMEILRAGFHGADEADSNFLEPQLFQHNNLSIELLQTNGTNEGRLEYHFKIRKTELPDPGKMQFGEDLLAFDSHEQLVWYFGDQYVKKDNYFLSGNEVIRCSILFRNTPRQVVFLWKDEKNRRDLAGVLFGGQQYIENGMGQNGFVAENDWYFKNGIKVGMPLVRLRMINDDNFNFHGGQSADTGLIIAQNSGKLDFDTYQTILGCINCNDEQFGNLKIVDADDAISDGRIAFILSVFLKNKKKQH